ncbi:MAG: dienelactone hydrolase family protein [Candidatus Acidiferrales bacterium]
MRRLAGWAAKVASVCLACAVLPLAAAPPKTEIVEYASGSETASGFLALPEAPGRHAAILLIHGDSGLTDWVQEQARGFAAQGYIALAADLYRGRVAADPEEAHELTRGLPDDRALRDVEAAFAYLAVRKDVFPGRIGAIGWQMGGWFALQLAIHEPRLAACAVSNTALPTDADDLARIRVPILGNFGADQRGISASRIEAFENDLRSRGIQVDVKLYADAGGDFENSADTNQFRPAPAADARTRDLAFFAKNLKK